MKVAHRQEPARTAAPGKQKLRLWLRMLRATRSVEGALRERLRKDFGETLPRFDVLAALHKADEGISLTRLSRMLMVSNGNVTGLIDRLVNEGYVARLALAGDRRTTLVRLTPAGSRHFERMAEVHERWVGTLLSGLDGDDADRVSEALRSIPRSVAALEAKE